MLGPMLPLPASGFAAFTLSCLRRAFGPTVFPRGLPNVRLTISRHLAKVARHALELEYRRCSQHHDSKECEHPFGCLIYNLLLRYHTHVTLTCTIMYESYSTKHMSPPKLNCAANSLRFRI